MKPIASKYALWLTLFCIAFLDVSKAPAQSTSVELLGTITANQASNGLGFNLDVNEWEWAAAAAAGATHARVQCSWSSVEQQTPPPNNAPAAIQYVQDPACVKAFGYAVKYGIHPTIVAAFGPPYHKILSVIVPGGAALGASSLDIELVAGIGGDTLANIKFPYDYICPAQNVPAGQAPHCATAAPGLPPFTYASQFEGALITSVTVKDATHATVMLASAIANAIPPGNTPYNVSEILYPSTLTELGTDPGVVAYGNYVSFLANDMAARGVTGNIEIWNEPPYNSDPWDNRCLLYDADLGPPCPSTTGSAPGPHDPNYGMVANLQNRTFPPGITATWNGTSGSGAASILGYRMFSRTGVYAKQPATTVASESFHVYGNSPEQIMWEADCLEATAKAYPARPASNSNNCFLPGEPTSSNNSGAVQLDMVAKLKDPTYGVAHMVTETGMLPPVAGLQTAQARFVLRQFLGFEADGLTPVEFFKLWTGLPDPSFGFVEHSGTTSAFSPYPAYTAISGFMGDIKPISNLPVASYSSAALPSVTNYSGTYPLSTVHMVGSRTGASDNSDAFIVWQRSFAPCDVNNACGVWITQAPPSAGPVTVNIPSTLKVVAVVDLINRVGVSYTTSGHNISFVVADDPIEILVDPASSATGPVAVALPTVTVLTPSLPTSTYAAPVTLQAVVSPYTSKSNSTDGETVAFFSGSTQVGVGTLAHGVASINVTSLPVGTNSLAAKYAGDANFAASAGFATVLVSTAVPTLSLSAISTQTFGVAPVTVTATSNSPGAISLSVLSGPAVLATSTTSGGTFTITGVGTVVLGAVQAASGGYSASSLVTTSFTVLAKGSGLTFTPVANVTYGVSPFTVLAKSSSKAATTYQVVSGPATISGNLVTITGAGPVVLEADQVASGSYTASSAHTTFTVNPATPTLNFTPVSNQIYGAAPITLSAGSVSSGAITYTVVSGPASVSGNIVSITGAGTVVLKASQAASGNYAVPSPAQISFTVGVAHPTLAIAAFTIPSYGQAPFALSATSNSPAAVTYKILAGPATISGNVVTITGASTVVVQASLAASANYTGALAQTSFVVAPAIPQLTFTPVQNVSVGAKPFRVYATSPSSGAITYTVVSGPATVSGYTVAVTGSGTVVLGAQQAALGNYAASQMIQTSFTVSDQNGKTAPSSALTLPVIVDQVYGAPPFSVTASSKSPGAITLSVVSGPAIISSRSTSGGTVTITGIGPVVLGASQLASGSYPAVPVTETSFTVLPADSQLTFYPIGPQTYGDSPFFVLAKSHARTPTIYTVLSGPAIISDNMVTLTGSGTVLLQATQAAADFYAGATVQKSFNVASLQ